MRGNLIRHDRDRDGPPGSSVAGAIYVAERPGAGGLEDFVLSEVLDHDKGSGQLPRSTAGPTVGGVPPLRSGRAAWHRPAVRELARYPCAAAPESVRCGNT